MLQPGNGVKKKSDFKEALLLITAEALVISMACKTFACDTSVENTIGTACAELASATKLPKVNDYRRNKLQLQSV